jgi:hypothetical protein
VCPTHKTPVTSNVEPGREENGMLGKPRAFVHFFIVVAVLIAVLAIQSKALNAAIGILGLSILFVGSVVALWRIWSERSNSEAKTFPSQIGWLPRKWRKWILGESDDDRR